MLTTVLVNEVSLLIRTIRGSCCYRFPRAEPYRVTLDT